ncbi:MAG: helix-turn-helix domain-containing protein [Ilumatobacteraceae bacterium]
MGNAATNDEGPLRLELGGADDQILLTIEEAARLLRIGRTTMYELMWARKIEPIRIGRRIRFTRASLERFVAEAPRRRR